MFNPGYGPSIFLIKTVNHKRCDRIPEASVKFNCETIRACRLVVLERIKSA